MILRQYHSPTNNDDDVTSGIEIQAKMQTAVATHASRGIAIIGWLLWRREYTKSCSMKQIVNHHVPAAPHGVTQRKIARIVPISW